MSSADESFDCAYPSLASPHYPIGKILIHVLWSFFQSIWSIVFVPVGCDSTKYIDDYLIWVSFCCTWALTIGLGVNMMVIWWYDSELDPQIAVGYMTGSANLVDVLARLSTNYVAWFWYRCFGPPSWTPHLCGFCTRGKSIEISTSRTCLWHGPLY